MDRQKFLPKIPRVTREQLAIEWARNHDVLHIGMGGFIDDPAHNAWYVAEGLPNSLHAQLIPVARSLVGLDINPTVVEGMKTYLPGTYYVADVTDPIVVQQVQERFDVILFCDVIEHQDNFHEALANLRALSRPGGRLVITTANAYCWDGMLKMGFGYESCHSEHTAYFSYLTLKRLLAMNGFTAQQFYFTMQTRSQFTSVLDQLSFTLLRGVSCLFPQFSSGIACVATIN